MRRLARDAVTQAESITDVVNALVDEGVVEPSGAEGLNDLLRMCERALRRAPVDPAVGGWIREDGASLLVSLDLMLPS